MNLEKYNGLSQNLYEDQGSRTHPTYLNLFLAMNYIMTERNSEVVMTIASFSCRVLKFGIVLDP
jgi:hypothetical protein